MLNRVAVGWADTAKDTGQIFASIWPREDEKELPFGQLVDNTGLVGEISETLAFWEAVNVVCGVILVRWEMTVFGNVWSPENGVPCCNGCEMVWVWLSNEQFSIDVGPCGKGHDLVGIRSTNRWCCVDIGPGGNDLDV